MTKKISETQRKTIREETRDKRATRQTEKNKMARVSSSLSVVTLNEKGLNIPVKRHSTWVVFKDN